MPASAPQAASKINRRRRRYPRYRDDFRVEVNYFQGDHYGKVEGHCRDLSEAGIGLLLAAELSCGEVVGLSFALPGSSEPWELRAVVRYRRGYHFGFEFLSLPRGQQEFLRNHLKGLKSID